MFPYKNIIFFPQRMKKKNEANQKKFGPSPTKNITFVSMAIVRVYWLLYVRMHRLSAGAVICVCVGVFWIGLFVMQF